MAVPPYLVTRNRNGTSICGRMVGGTTITQIGGAISGGDESGAAAYEGYLNNRVVQFGNMLVCLNGNYTNSTVSPWTTWTGALNTLQHTTYKWAQSGLHLVDVAGVPTLVYLYITSGLNQGVATSTNGTSWTYANKGQGYSTNIAVGRSFVYRNNVFWLTAHNGLNTRLVQFDPSSGAATFYDTVGGSNTPILTSACMCVFGNELYLLAFSSRDSGSHLNLYKLSGGTFVLVQRVGTTATGGSLLGRGYTLRTGVVIFADNGKLHCIASGYTGSSNRVGAHCFELTPSGSTFTEVNRTQATLPSALRTTDESGSITTTTGQYFRWYVGIDNETDPTNPAVYLWFLNTDNGGSFSYYEWGGPLATITPGSSAGSVGLAMPATPEGGGERWWTEGELHIELLGAVIGLGGSTLSFKAYGGGSGHFVRFYYNADEQAANTQCSLIGTPTGGSATRNVNQVENVAADGSTTYTITWDFTGDGISIGDNVLVMPKIDI